MKNNITEVPGPLFKDLTALKFLNISHNGINKFGSQFVNFSQTNFHLDLSYNHITSLNNEDLQSLNKFANKTVLNFMGNHFVCDCSISEFLAWSNISTVPLYNFNQYVCDGPNEWAGKSLAEFGKHEINCIFYSVNVILFSIAAAFIITMIIFYIRFITLYRKSFIIHRLLYTGKRFLRGWLGVEGPAAPEGKFDAYVSISEHDKVWALEHLLPGIDSGEKDKDHPFGGQFRLHYENRDAVPGASKCENINNNLEKSKKVIIILSEKYMQHPTRAENSMELDRANIMLHEQNIEDIIVVQLRNRCAAGCLCGRLPFGSPEGVILLQGYCL